MFGSFDFQEFLSAFIVLFAVIDIIGSIPIILNLKQKGRNVNANKATFISFALLLGFFYAGDMMLKLFQVDIASFAVAGAFVIFLMSLEMILDIEIFKNHCDSVGVEYGMGVCGFKTDRLYRTFLGKRRYLCDS